MTRVESKTRKWREIWVVEWVNDLAYWQVGADGNEENFLYEKLYSLAIITTIKQD